MGFENVIYLSGSAPGVRRFNKSQSKALEARCLKMERLDQLHRADIGEQKVVRSSLFLDQWSQGQNFSQAFLRPGPRKFTLASPSRRYCPSLPPPSFQYFRIQKNTTDRYPKEVSIIPPKNFVAFVDLPYGRLQYSRNIFLYQTSQSST